MTTLELKDVRDSLGIDSFERAFVYAALGLRTVTTQALEPNSLQLNAYSDAIKINIVNRTVNLQTSANPFDQLAVISIQGTLPYDRIDALSYGGNFLRSVREVSSQYYRLYLLEGNLPPSPLPNFVLPDDPNWVYTLESYFVWTATEILRHYYLLALWKNDYLNDLCSMKITHSDDNSASQGYIRIDARIPMYYLFYLESFILLRSVHSIIDKNV